MLTRDASSGGRGPGFVRLALVAVVLSGCAGAPNHAARSSHGVEHRQFILKHIDANRARDILSQLEAGTSFVMTGREIVLVRGTSEEVERAAVVLELVDTQAEYTVETLVPAAQARGVPSNPEITRRLGDIAVGTFADPPQAQQKARAIVDVCGDNLVGIVPATRRQALRALVVPGDREVSAAGEESTSIPPAAATREPDVRPIEVQTMPVSSTEVSSLSGGSEPNRPRGRLIVLPANRAASARTTSVPGDQREFDQDIDRQPADLRPEIPPVVLARGGHTDQTTPATLAHADEVLQLDLPSQLDMIELLDLVGEYLELDYMYDPAKIRGQVVTLKMHGKLRGRMTVKDLYVLLESVLKFKGFAMTCHEGNLVTIVPAAEVLQTNPDLVDGSRESIDPGDMVVTGVFDLQSIDASSASSLLQNMKLSLVVTPVEGSRMLIVTCYAHQMDRIERLLDVVDRPGRPKEFRFRQLRYTLARALTNKVQQLASRLRDVSVIADGPVPGPNRDDRPRPMVAAMTRTVRGPGGPGPAEEAVFLDADERTNRILMIGYREQLAVVEELIDALDVAQQDLRVGKIYDIRHVDAEEVKRKLQELELTGGVGPGRGSSAAAKITSAEIVEGTVTEAAQVVVLEATNSLIINASEEQHDRIEAMLAYLDAEVQRETIPYEIYFLENQDPENLAQILEKIVHETAQDPEGKLQQVARNVDDRIMIVPDQQTFSLIVNASRKNQEWISKLITALDRRRPQVLIDVTLVEIRKTDEFNYDLNLVTSLPDLIQTSGQTGSFFVGDQSVTERLLEPGAPSQFADLQVSSGEAAGFYADVHINALLKAMQQKNYGRVLAKPKVLVNDNETGTIKTTDTTYVTKKTSIPVTSGSAGSQNTLIETAIDYAPYDAGITLEITPHISTGQLLRLEIDLTRSDFTLVTGEKPPDQTSSDINTVVTVPDGSTIILGGMLRLNQSKGGKKIPILGDLPIIGLPFRSIANSDIQSKLYIFVKAEVIRPSQRLGPGDDGLRQLSQENRAAFEASEAEFQSYQNWPGIKTVPVEPANVLEAQ